MFKPLIAFNIKYIKRQTFTKDTPPTCQQTYIIEMNIPIILHNSYCTGMERELLKQINSSSGIWIGLLIKRFADREHLFICVD